MSAQFLEAFTRLDNCLKERMRAFHTPALVMALTDRNRLVRLSAFGYANVESQTPVQTDHLFAIGSVGKSFTSIAILQACEAGLLDIHAPVKTFLPWFEVRSRYEPITIHHLLTHSSGLPHGTDFSPDPRGEVYALRDVEPGYAPGEHFSYSDTGYKILGLVVEAVTERPFSLVIKEKILDPLEMDHTFAATSSDLRPRMATGYRYLFDDRPASYTHPLVPAAWIETNSGDGCIVSNAEDMAKYARMLLNRGIGVNGPLISEQSFKKLVRPMIEEEGEAYSYGLTLFEDDGYRVAGHGGDVPGYQAYMWLDLNNGLGTVVMMTEPYTPRASFLVLEFFRSAYLGLQLPDTPPLPDFRHVSNAAEYEGTYESDVCQLVLEADGYHLYLVHNSQRILLEQRDIDSFYADHPDWERYMLRFGRSENGDVVEVFYGPQWFTNDRFRGDKGFLVPAEWLGYTGHYRSHDPWATNFRVFTRKGRLILSEPNGEEEVLVQLGQGLFRIGEEEYIPERLQFDQMIDGQALRAVRSGCPYYRFFTP